MKQSSRALTGTKAEQYLFAIYKTAARVWTQPTAEIRILPTKDFPDRHVLNKYFRRTFVSCSKRFVTSQPPGDRNLAALIEENEASAEVTTVYADIKATRGVDWINNFWKAIPNHPAPQKRMWDNVKQVMAPGALDPLTKELVYIAVSITNNFPYCIASPTASARGKGMTDEQFA